MATLDRPWTIPTSPFRRRPAAGTVRGNLLDRPCPAAEGSDGPTRPLGRADARFEAARGSGEWGNGPCRRLPERWIIVHGPLRFELKRTDFGHVGLFAEQAENWAWILDEAEVPLRSASQRVRKSIGLKKCLLDLFAYTGGSTLSAAAAGTEVVHVDAAQNVVAWARRNAELSGPGRGAGRGSPRTP